MTIRAKATGANDLPSGATTVDSNWSGTGTINGSDDKVDWWVVHLSELGRLRITLDVPSGQDFELELYSSNATTKLGSSLNGSGQDEEIIVTMTYSGPYYIKVFSFGSSSGTYTLRNNTLPPVELTLHRISDASGTANSSDPGNSKSTFYGGEIVRITLKANNIGSSTPVAAVLNVRGPNNSTIVYDSHPLNVDNTADSPLNANETDYYSFDWTIPGNATLGSYDIGASIRRGDDWTAVLDTTASGRGESNFSGMWLTDRFMVVDGARDLTKQVDNLSATSGYPGDTLNVTVTVKNEGAAAAGASSMVHYYWRKDTAEYSNANKVGEDMVANLSAGGTENESFAFTIPADAIPGTYKLYYWIDATGAVSESDENNNRFEWTVTVFQSTRILGVGYEPSDGSQGTVGQTKTVKVTVGAEIAQAGVLQVWMYDSDFSTEDTKWSYISAPQSVSRDFVLSLMEAAAGPRDYATYVQFRPGATAGPINSSSAADVIWSESGYTIDWSETQLTISSLTPSAVENREWGQSITYSITVRDQSNGAVEDAVIQVNDELRSGVFNSSGTDGNGKVTYTTTVPNGKASGSYDITFVAYKPGHRSSPSVMRRIQVVPRSIVIVGRVRSARTRSPIDGVRVSVGDQSSLTTLPGGEFTLSNVSMSSSLSLIAAKDGYITHTGTIALAPEGTSPFALPDLFLQENVGEARPIVTGIRPKYDGLFLSGASLMNQYTASVQWNGKTPASVEFYVNGNFSRTVETSGEEATADIDMGLGFFGSLSLGANRVSVVAVSGDGTRSAMFDQAVTILPMPLFLVDQGILTTFEFIPDIDVGPFHLKPDPAISWEFKFPRAFLSARDVQEIPFVGNFGPDLNFDVGFDYKLHTGEWGLFVGKEWDRRLRYRSGRRPNSTPLLPKFYFGNVDFNWGFGGKAEGVASHTRGIELESVGVQLSADVRVEILSFYITDYVPGGQLVRLLDHLKGLGVDVNSIQRVRVDGLLDADLSTMARFPSLEFDRATLKVTPAVEAIYEPNVWVAHGSIAVGGSLGFDLQLAPRFGMEEITGAIYMKLQFNAWLMKHYEETFIILSGTIYQRSPNISASADARAQAVRPLVGSGDWVVYRDESEASPTLRRDYLQAGPERFVAAQSAFRLAAATGASALDTFRLLGQRAVRGSVMEHRQSAVLPVRRAEPTTMAKTGQASEVPQPAASQADLTLVQNAFPNSSPAIASRGTELMLLYVTDNGSSNALQFTDIKWTLWDGLDWSVPATLHANTQAEFDPQVAYDGNGDVIAVWERVADPSFNVTNLTAMAAEMEIVWSKWSRMSGSWSTPAALTSNGYLDHSPLVCGPMTNGMVLATWTANESNLLMGTNGAGSHVMWAEWDPANQTWSTPQTLLADLPYRLSQSLAGANDHAIYSWTRDFDGELTNDADQHVFYSRWSLGAWDAATQFTTGTNGNRNVRVATSSDGDCYLVWQQGTNLLLSRDFSTNTILARADSRTAGFADYAMTIGPAGNLVLLWQEMSQAGSDAHYAVYDPVSGTWSRDDLLSLDAPLERSFAPVWDNVGNLTVAYNKVQMLTTNLTVTLDGGGTVTITNVPQSGSVDLLVTKRALVKDLALLPGDFSLRGNDYLPGDLVTLSALVRNVGNIAVSNVVVSFYDGNPTNGGTVLTNVTMPGWLQAAATNVAEALWIVPEPATNHVLYAVVNSNALATEFEWSNNQQFVTAGGTDLAVKLISYDVETNGAVRVIAQVQNLGAPLATNSVLSIRRGSGSAISVTGPVLASADVPLLEPGRLAQVALDIPAGTQAETEAFYQLTTDETSVLSDVEVSNNTTTFAAIRWVGVETTPANTPPAISSIANQTTRMGVPTDLLSFTISDAETAATSLLLSGTSANQSLVPNTNIIFGGEGTSRTVTVTPAVNQMGTTLIELTVSDGSLSSVIGFELTVNADPIPPTLTMQPQSFTALVGTNVTFTVEAVGSSPLIYQWKKDGMNIASATNASYAISDVQTAHAGAYSVVVRNAAGSVTSETVTLMLDTGVGVLFTAVGGAVTTGGNITVPIKVSRFVKVTSFQFTLVWDTAVLQYVSNGSYGLTDITPGHFGTQAVSNGGLTIAWQPSDGLPVTVADGTTLFAITFKAVGTAGTYSSLSFESSPMAKEVTVSLAPDMFLGESGTIEVQSTVNLGGKVVYYMSNVAVPGVEVDAFDAASVKAGNANTVNDGSFTLAVIPGTDYAVQLSKLPEAPSAQGVTTLDITLVRRHILGIAALDSPYKALAADVNGSSSVTTLDITLIRRLILGIATNYPNGSLWRFVRSDYEFNDPATPWSAEGTRTYTNLDSDLVDQNFIGIKLGDVNGSWTAPSATLASGIAVVEGLGVRKSAGLAEVWIELGQPRSSSDGTVRIPVIARRFDQVTSLQWTLGWGPDLIFRRLDAFGLRGLGEDNFGLTQAGEGKLAFSWDDPEGRGSTLPEGQALFIMEFESRGANEQPPRVEFLDDPTPREAGVNGALANFRTVGLLGDAGLGSSVAPVVVTVRRAGLNLLIELGTERGFDYLLEYAEALDGSPWRELRTIAGDGTVRSFQNLPAHGQQRFYRVRVD